MNIKKRHVGILCAAACAIALPGQTTFDHAMLAYQLKDRSAPTNAVIGLAYDNTHASVFYGAPPPPVAGGGGGAPAGGVGAVGGGGAAPPPPVVGGTPWGALTAAAQASYAAALTAEWNALVDLAKWTDNAGNLDLKSLGDKVRSLEYRKEIELIAAARPADGTGLGIASVLGMGQSAAIEGITKWALKRAEEELMQAFLKQWLDSLQKQPYLGLMMPTTLNTISTTSLSVLLTDGDLWRSSFTKDLDKSPERLDSLLILVLTDVAGTNNARKLKFDELACAGQVFGDVYRALKDGRDLETELVLSAERLVKTKPRRPVSGTSVEYAVAHRALIMASVLFEASRVGDKAKPDHIDPLVLMRMSSERFKTYWKFICAIHATHIMEGMKIGEAQLEKYADDESLIKGKQALTDIVELVGAIQRLCVPDAAGAKEKKLDADAVLNLLSQVMSLLERSADIATHDTRAGDGGAWKFFREVANPSLEHLKNIHAAVVNDHYGDAVTGMIDLSVMLMTLNTTTDGLDNTGTVNNPRLKRLAESLNKYGGFMVDVIFADSTAQVEAALKRVMAGTGSYRSKMASTFSVDLSLFPGVFGGKESLSTDENKFGSEPIESSALGAYLPIGLAFTWGTGGKYIPSIGAYVQVLDLGTALSYEIDPPDSVSVTPSYTWDMMLSPGGYLTFQLGRSPITLGIGANVAPRLRDITVDGMAFRSNATRVGAFIGVDVTALHLYSSRKKIGSSWKSFGDR